MNQWNINGPAILQHTSRNADVVNDHYLSNQYDPSLYSRDFNHSSCNQGNFERNGRLQSSLYSFMIDQSKPQWNFHDKATSAIESWREQYNTMHQLAPPGFGHLPVPPSIPSFHGFPKQSVLRSPSPTSSYSSITPLSSEKSFVPLYSVNNSSTQTDINASEIIGCLSDFILTGCDESRKIAHLMPNCAKIQEFSDSGRKKALNYLVPNKCSQYESGATENTILDGYITSYFSIVDSLMLSRKCFGTTDLCNGLCSLGAPDLPDKYLQWLNATQGLLSSINRVLQTANRMYMTESCASGINHTQHLPVPSTGQIINPHSHNNEMHKTMQQDKIKNKSAIRKYAGQSCPLLPVPPQAFVNEVPSSQGAYMQPASYNVARNELSPLKKKQNIEQARAVIFKEMTRKCYVVPLTHSVMASDSDTMAEDRSDIGSDASSVKVYQIAVREQSMKTKCVSQDINQENYYQNCSATASEFRNFTTLKRSLPEIQASRFFSILQILYKYDLPSAIKYPYKDDNMPSAQIVKYPITLESIGNKVRTSAYETYEQFIYDCRCLFLNAALYSKKDKRESERVLKLKRDFEYLIQAPSQDLENWNHINNDFKEVSCKSA